MLRCIRDFLQNDLVYDVVTNPLIDAIVISINTRISILKTNKALHIATILDILDPRFAYNEDYWNKQSWLLCEQELFDFYSKILNNCV